jgi:hypothetical protein
MELLWNLKFTTFMNFFGYWSFDACQKRPLVEIYLFHQQKKRSSTLLVAKKKQKTPPNPMSYTTSRRYCRSPRRIRQAEGREALASFSSLFVFVPLRSLFSRAICRRMRLTGTQKQASEEGSNKYRHPKQGSRVTKHTRSSSSKSRFAGGSLLHGVEHLGKTVIPNSVAVICRALSVCFL